MFVLLFGNDYLRQNFADMMQRVLVLEDDLLIGLDLAQSLARGGFEACGPFKRVVDAEEYVDENEVAAALLDVNLGGGETSMAFASDLLRRGVPFLFLTGYAAHDSQFEEEFQSVRRLSKPCKPQTVIDAVDGLIQTP